MWIAFVTLARVERSQLVAELSERAAHGSEREAMLAVRQLARMSRPPLDTLVSAAAAPNPLVADEARLAIDDLLRKWQRQLKSGYKPSEVTDQLRALAVLLDGHREAFTPYDYSWLRRTAERIVRLANRASPGANATLAMHCDSLLSLATQEVAPTNAASTEPIIVATRPRRTDSAEPEQSPAPNAANRAGSASPSPDGVFNSLPKSAMDSLVPTDNSEAGRISPTYGAATSNWRPQWSPPLSTAAVGAQPLTFRPRRVPSLVEATSPNTVILRETSLASASQFANLDTRSLMRQWLETDGSASLEIERELKQRGFHHLLPTLVRSMLSANAADRERLVFEVMGAPGIDAKPWLTLLAEDVDAGVRFAAVSMMATSSDPDLVERALEVALHDRDPRVASLAERLRSRRSGAGRR